MRFQDNLCDHCISVCKYGAIELEPKLFVNQNQCVDCLMCLSACPTDALAMNESDPSFILRKLINHPTPVLSCDINSNLKATIKTGCLGWLSEEYLLFLALYSQKKIQINLTACASCEKNIIVENLECKIQSVQKKIGINIFDQISLVFYKSDLKYEEMKQDRRKFFQSLKKMAAQQITNIIETQPEKSQTIGYGQKILPFKRKVLNKALTVTSDEITQNILKNYYYDLSVSEDCDQCAECVAICPTGALTLESANSDESLKFDHLLCNGCTLCVEFCGIDALRIKKAFCPETKNVQHHEKVLLAQ